MSTNPADGTHQDGAEPVYGPAYAASNAGARPEEPAPQPVPTQAPHTPDPLPFDGPSPPYTAPYPPYPSDVPYTTGIPTNVAAGLAYLVAPAVLFLLLPAYRSKALIRFHSWQAIFYFLVSVAAREIEMLLVSMLPSPVAFTIGGLLLLLLFAGWLIAVLKALQGIKWSLPIIGNYAEQTANNPSTH